MALTVVHCVISIDGVTGGLKVVHCVIGTGLGICTIASRITYGCEISDQNVGLYQYMHLRLGETAREKLQMVPMPKVERSHYLPVRDEDIRR